jgi:hypothetical protein
MMSKFNTKAAYLMKIEMFCLELTGNWRFN